MSPDNTPDTMLARYGRPASLVAAGLLAGTIVAGTVTATAQTATPAPPAPSASVSTPPVPVAPPLPRRDLRGRGHGGHKLFGDVLHGEFVSPKPGGGYRTLQTHRGTATAVSASEITVKSEDGFTRTYAVNEDTLVNAARDGITSIAVNDLVHVRALGAGAGATATAVVDVTKMKAYREKFAPERKQPNVDAPQPNA